MLIRQVPSSFILLVGLAPAALGAESSAGLTAILTQVDGAVQLAGPGVDRVPLARLWQVVRAGVTVRVPEGGAAGIVCSSHRFVRLQGPASWSLTEQACAIGKELTPGEYSLVAPKAGRFKVVRGLLTLERDLREIPDDDPQAPVVLSPCNTTVRSPRPAISWSRVPQAIEYRITWSQRGNRRGTVAYDNTVKAQDVACTEEPDGPEVCVLPWPSDRPDLPPDEEFLLQIAARPKLTEPWRWASPVDVRTQRLAAAQTLDQRLEGLGELGLEGAALDIAQAGLFADEELYADAAEFYRHALVLAPSLELHVTLADIYLTVGLYQRAETRYRKALVEGASPDIQAAATFGLGRIEYARGRFREAAAVFRQAREKYAALALKEEEAAARQAEEQAATRAESKP